MVATGIKECEINITDDLKMTAKGRRLVNIAKEMIEFASNKTWG